MVFTLPAASDTTFEQAPVGLYVFKLKELERGIQGDPQYGDKERVKWIFEVVRVIDVNENAPSREIPNPKMSEDWVGEEFWGFTSLSMGKKSTMRLWATALLGRDIDEGEQLNAGELIGKRAKATIGRSDTQRAKITALVPYVTKGTAPKAAPVAAPVDEGDDEELPF